MRLLFFFLLLFAPAWAAPEPPDAKTLELLNQGRDSDRKLQANQVVLLHPSDFPEVTLVGFLSGSNQALFGSAIVAGQVVSTADASRLALSAKGWEKADETEKKRLALLWLAQGPLGFGEQLVFEKPEGFVDREARFHPPQYLLTLSGSSRILVWVEEPSADAFYRTFRRSLYWLGKDGRTLRSRVLERYQLKL